MNFRIKDFVVPIILAIIVTIGFQYFFMKKDSGEKELQYGYSREAPRSEEEVIHRKLNLEVDFIDKKPSEEPKLTLVETDFAKYLFSTEGASIQKLEIKHGDTFLRTVNATGKEDLCLLIALDEKTPFYYQLISKDENKDTTTLTYRNDFDNGIITKKFIVYKHLCKVDLEIIVDTTTPFKEPTRLRIFYPSPSVPSITDDVIQGIFIEKDQVTKRAMSSILKNYWGRQSLFGTEDRFFINAMVRDYNCFIQRGYYKASGPNILFSILEGPAIKDKASWNWKLSFYFGPKKLQTISAVDSRLEQTLDYGFLSFLSKPLLSLLVFFNDYFKNYGIAIILLTLLITLLLLPFTLKGEQSMKKRMEFQRKLQYIQHKYKDDKEALALARAELLKKHGMPEMAGCLPLFLQLPIFIALNKVLSNSVELYNASFLWIPNLSMKDPYYILPIIIGLSMIFYSTATSTDPRKNLSTYAIAIVIAAFSAGLPAGLSLFIAMSSIFRIVQSKIITSFKKE